MFDDAQVDLPREELDQHFCNTCNTRTWHKVIVSINKELYFEPYSQNSEQEQFVWQVIECQGCKTMSLVENIYRRPDSEQDFLTQTAYYPSRKKRFALSLEEIHSLPILIRNIYTELKDAFGSDLLILAGAGLRTLLEAVCNDKGANGNRLSDKIDSLADMDFLTKRDAALLHRIRSIGNEAVHESKTHDKNLLERAIRITENLLYKIYIEPPL